MHYSIPTDTRLKADNNINTIIFDKLLGEYKGKSYSTYTGFNSITYGFLFIVTNL